MHIEDFKTWHWVVLGPIIGLIFGCVILYQGTAQDSGGLDTLDQPHFERAAAGMLGRRRDEALIGKAYAASHPLLANLVVHPPVVGDPKGMYWVTGWVLGAEARPKDSSDPHSKLVSWTNWRRFRYGATAPYHAILPEANTYQNVMAYLNSLQTTSTGVKAKYQYAWYDNAAATLIQLGLAGLLVIGIAWPMTLHVMQGAGLARMPTKKVKLSKGKPAMAGAAVDHSAGDRQLDELNTQLEEGLAAGATASTPGAGVVAAQAPIKALTGAEIAAAEQAEKERQIREYGGEFYPVAKTTHKETEGEAGEKKHEGAVGKAPVAAQKAPPAAAPVRPAAPVAPAAVKPRPPLVNPGGVAAKPAAVVPQSPGEKPTAPAANPQPQSPKPNAPAANRPVMAPRPKLVVPGQPPPPPKPKS